MCCCSNSYAPTPVGVAQSGSGADVSSQDFHDDSGDWLDVFVNGRRLLHPGIWILVTLIFLVVLARK